MQNLKRNFILIGLVVLFVFVPLKDTLAAWSVFHNAPGDEIPAFIVYNNELYAGTCSYASTSANTNKIHKHTGLSWTITQTDCSIYGIRSFEEYNNELYAGDNRGKIFKYNSAASPPWETFYDMGTNEDLNSLVAYNGGLYATGIDPISTLAEIYKYDGGTWNNTNFGILGVWRLHSLIVYNNELYAGTGHAVNKGKIFKYDGANWHLIDTITEAIVSSFAVYNGNLYAASKDNGKIFRYDGANFNMVRDTGETYISSLIAYNNELYAGGVGNAKITKYNGTSWSVDNDIPENRIFSLAEYNGKLYAGTTSATVYEYSASGPIPPIPPIPPSTTFFEGLVPCGRHYDNPDTDNVNESDECTVCHFFYLIKNLIDFVAGIAVVVAILFIAFGGVMYIGSTGNEAMLSKAKGIITYAIIGFILIFTAYIIIGLILSTFGYTNPLGGEWDVIC